MCAVTLTVCEKFELCLFQKRIFRWVDYKQLYHANQVYRFLNFYFPFCADILSLTYCFFSITDGATLQLVLAMRGGPINTRRSEWNYFMSNV